MNAFAAEAAKKGLSGGATKPSREKEPLDIRDHGDVSGYETIGVSFVDNAKMSARNVNVFYAEKQAIRDVSLDIGHL